MSRLRHRSRIAPAMTVFTAAMMSTLGALVGGCGGGTPGTSTTGGCAEPSKVCSGVCVDLKSDPRHCGACGTACPTGQVCSDGKCGTYCGTDLTACAGSCVNLADDPNNCGACGTTCAAGQACKDS